MLAARILRLARTRRCAIVASGTRKARAISAVSSPPSSRSVSATWTPVARAGWQQVKIRRRRSSGTGPTSLGASRWWRRAASACRWWRDASRRSRSIARFLAVVRIQPPGFGGTPDAGQRWTATTKASWTASSAMSMSPKRRTRVATARPNSCRKVCSTREASRMLTPRLGLRLVLEGAHLDRSLAGCRALGRPGQRGVEVGGADDPEAAQLLLRLGERTVGGQDLAVLDPHHGGGLCRVQPAGEHPGALLLELGVEHVHVLVGLLHHLGRRDLALDHVHGQEV